MLAGTNFTTFSKMKGRMNSLDLNQPRSIYLVGWTCSIMASDFYGNRMFHISLKNCFSIIAQVEI